MKFKVLIIEGTSKLGGAQFDNILIQRSKQTKISYVTLCPEEGDLSEKLRIEGKNVVVKSMPKLISTSFIIKEKSVLNPFALLNNFFSYFVYAINLRKFIKKNQFDLIVTNGMNPHFYGGLAARFSNTPSVFRLMDVIRKDMLSGFARKMFQFYVKLVNAHVIVPSKAVSTEMFSSEVIDKKVTVIYNGTDLNDFSRDSSVPILREEFNILDNEIVFGCYSRLIPWKGHRTFITAAINFLNNGNKAKFLIVGGVVFGKDDFMNDLKKMVTEAKQNDNIIFAGFRYDMGNCIQSSDVVVVPSIHPDPCPRVMVESMALSKAMIGSNLGGIPEVIENNVTGIITKFGDVKELENAFLFFINNKSKIKEMGDNGFSRQMLLYSLDNYQKKHEDCFLSLINNYERNN
ncbi:glycosyltransferase family 4 protein [uncultured Polaribacter sp.]|uniref:glycosyltransferase family 4 protein n=1 Tax=uncultured Polaribacter sp. TaxID=174711 RepID=UPI00259AF8A0|nr:glycosyltransferase family 4 protein [uncultured Polaribacter sp.]